MKATVEWKNFCLYWMGKLWETFGDRISRKSVLNDIGLFQTEFYWCKGAVTPLNHCMIQTYCPTIQHDKKEENNVNFCK